MVAVGEYEEVVGISAGGEFRVGDFKEASFFLTRLGGEFMQASSRDEARSATSWRRVSSILAIGEFMQASSRDEARSTTSWRRVSSILAIGEFMQKSFRDEPRSATSNRKVFKLMLGELLIARCSS